VSPQRSLDDSALGGPPAGSTASSPREAPQDLGFGAVVSRESRQRLLNRDGTFNVRRKGLGLVQSLSAYHLLLEITWPRFLALVCGWYVITNAVFASLYMTLGADAFAGIGSEGVGSGAWAFFFFSVQTLATIGYGHVVPLGLPANLMVTGESLVGLLSFGLAAGLIFARFARPTARILFSDVALMAPFRGGTAFMFRMVNARRSQIVELEAKVVMVRRRVETNVREYHALSLERERVVFFPLAWTVVHVVDESSPLHGVSREDLARQDTEFLVLLTGFDDTFAQIVHARSSYLGRDLVWGRRFADMFEHGEDQVLSVDVSRLSETV
jgi:inward rectifier potassium channel